MSFSVGLLLGFEEKLLLCNGLKEKKEKKKKRRGEKFKIAVTKKESR